MKKWIDLSLHLNEQTLPYPGDERLKITWEKTLGKDGYNLSNVSTSMHLGTHIDYKSHVLNEQENHDINQWIGKANVLFIDPKDDVISTMDIEHAYQALDHKEKMLLISFNHQRHLGKDAYYKYPKFESSIFEFLKQHEISLLGSDLPSYEYQEGDLLRMHIDCLSNDIYLLENVMNLKKLNAQIELMVVPLPIDGLEASLVRAIARNL